MNQQAKKTSPIYVSLVFIITSINLILIGIPIATWVVSAQYHQFVDADFIIFYTASSMVRAGDGDKLYDLDVQSAYQKEIKGEIEAADGLLPFVNPPFVALFFAPISLFSFDTAYYLWSLTQLGLITGLVFLLRKLFSNWNKNEQILLTLTLLAFWPLGVNLLMGQVSLVILIGVILMYRAVTNSRQGQAGLWLFLMLVKPQTALIPGMIAFNKRNKNILIAAVLAGILAVLGSSIFLGLETWTQYVEFSSSLSGYFGKYGFFPESQYTLRGMLTSLLGYSQGNLVNRISYLALIGGMVLAWRLWSGEIPAGNPRHKLNYSFILTLSVFLAIHSYCDVLILAFPAALFYDYLRQKDYSRTAYSLFVLVSPLVFILADFTRYELFGFLRPPVLVILLLLGWMAWHLVLEGRSGFSQGKVSATSNSS